ncbi:MAG: YehR family protein [Bacilli bacterium]|nr:YehR family protein [Bacilli bacterium]
MKKNILKVLLLPVISLLLVTGCSEKEDYFETAKKNMQELESYSMDINIEMGMDVGGIMINLPMTLNSDIDMINKMSKMKMSSEFMDNSLSSTTYVDGSDENNMIQYSTSDGITWEMTEAKDNNQVNNLVNPDNIKEIKSDDKDYYVYEATLDKDQMSGIIDKDLTDNDMMGSIDITDNIVFKYYINKKTKYFEKIVADLTDVMDVTGEESGQKVKLTKLNFEIKFSNFNEAPKVVIPDDVKNSSIKPESVNTKTMKCHLSKNQSGAEFDLSYFADYKESYVTNIRSNEKIVSNDISILETYKSQVERNYAPFDNVEYYNYNVKIEGDTLISTTDIDYSKIDIGKVLEIDPSSSSLIKNGKININTLKKAYESIGATCEMEYDNN